MGRPSAVDFPTGEVFVKHFFQFLAAARSTPPKIEKNASHAGDGRYGRYGRLFFGMLVTVVTAVAAVTAVTAVFFCI